MDIHYDYDRFGCRHTLLSIVSHHRVTLFFSFLRVLSFVLLFSFNPLLSSLFFLFFLVPPPPLMSLKVLHVRVYVRSLFFPLVFFFFFFFGAFGGARHLTGIE